MPFPDTEHPVDRALRDAPIDDEPYTDEERAAVADARASIARGEPAVSIADIHHQMAKIADAQPPPDPILVDLEARAYAAGRFHERALVIAWIRELAARLPPHKQLAASHIADEIARLSHHPAGH